MGISEACIIDDLYSASAFSQYKWWLLLQNRFTTALPTFQTSFFVNGDWFCYPIKEKSATQKGGL